MDIILMVCLLILGIAGVGDFTTPVINGPVVAGGYLLFIAGIIAGRNL